MVPRPLHLGQTVLSENSPWLSSSVPLPPQRSQVWVAVPGAAPLPLQVWQRASSGTLTDVVTPRTASSKDEVQLGLDVGPPLGTRGRRRRPVRPPPNRPPKRSPRSPRSSTRNVPPARRDRRPPPGRRSRRPSGRAADLVVLLALGGVAEHVVGGRDLLEAVLRAGVGVGVVLLGQLAVGPGDLLVGGRRATRRAPGSSPSRTTRAVAPCSALAPGPWPGAAPGRASGSRPAAPRRPSPRPSATAPASVRRRVRRRALRRVWPAASSVDAAADRHRGSAGTWATASWTVGSNVDPGLRRPARGPPWPGRRAAARAPGRAPAPPPRRRRRSSPPRWASGQVEGVEHRQQLGHQVDGGPGRLLLLLAQHPLAVVLEVGLQRAASASRYSSRSAARPATSARIAACGSPPTSGSAVRPTLGTSSSSGPTRSTGSASRSGSRAPRPGGPSARPAAPGAARTARCRAPGSGSPIAGAAPGPRRHCSSTISASTTSSSDGSSSRTGRRPPPDRRRPTTASLGGLLVQALREALAGGQQRLGGGLDGLDVGARQGVLHLLQGRADVLLLGALELLALVPQQLLGLVHEGVGGVADLGLLAATTVVLGVRLGVAHHPLDVVLGAARTDR